MTASVPSFWRVSLSLPPSITPTLVELHLLLSSNPTHSFIQPPSTTSATSPTSTTFGSAAYSPITHPQQLLPYFPSSNAALNFSLSSSSTTSFLSALFNANPSEAVQLNYLMKEEGEGVWDVGYVAFQPYLNQTLWYYYTLHTEKGGLDTDWQSMGADEGVEASPTSPPATLSGAEAAVIDDSSNPTSATVVFEQSFAWEAGVIRAVTGPTPPGGGGDGGGGYRIAFATNVSHAVLWLNVEWAVDGVVVKSSMTGLSSTQWVSPTLTLTPSDVLIYNFTWWALADNTEVVSPLHFLYRLPTTDASALTASATAGASRLPGGKVLGDGQSLWGNIAASTPSFPAMSLPTSPFASLSSTSTGSSVVGTITSGLTSLLTSLSTLQSAPAVVLPASHDVTVTALNASIQSTTSLSVVAPSHTVSAESLLGLLTPLSIVGSLAGLTSPTSSSSLSSASTYAESAFCVIPCATSSPTTDVMVSCLGGCFEPFLPSSLSSGQATTLINGIHDYLLSSINSATPTTTPSSTSTVTPHVTLTASNVTSNVSANASTQATPSNTTAASPVTRAVGGMVGPPTLPSTSSSNSALASAVAQWLLTNSASSTSSPFFPPPIISLGGALSSGLGALSTPLLAGLSSLGTGPVQVTSDPTAHTLSISSSQGGVTLPISALAALLQPLISPGQGLTLGGVGAAASYVGGLSCMLPCITEASVGVQGTSNCLGGCINAVVPNAGSDGATFTDYVTRLFTPLPPVQAVGGRGEGTGRAENGTAVTSGSTGTGLTGAGWTGVGNETGAGTAGTKSSLAGLTGTSEGASGESGASASNGVTGRGSGEGTGSVESSGEAGTGISQEVTAGSWVAAPGVAGSLSSTGAVYDGLEPESVSSTGIRGNANREAIGTSVESGGNASSLFSLTGGVAATAVIALQGA